MCLLFFFSLFQIETLNIEIDHFQCVEHELRERVLQLENLLRSHLDHTHMHSLSVSFETEENGTLQQDLLALRMDVVRWLTEQLQ